MKTSNVLANIFDWFGDALERFNPSAFRFLAAVLPYLTPIPVAWLTAHSASEFLNFTPEIAFILVFALEGIGLWFTTMFVDAVVDWVRSRNWKSFVPVLMFAFTVAGYVMLLVDLNVTLEAASGNMNPALSRVITLLCFLPLITGIGNGYYKLKLEHKTEAQKSMERQVEQQVRKEQMEIQARFDKEKLEAQTELELERLKHQERLELEQLKQRQERWKLKLEHETSIGTNGSGNGNRGTSRTPKSGSKTSNGTSRTPSINQQRVFSYLEQQAELRGGEVPSFTEVMEELELPQSTASRLRNEWINTKQ